MSKIKGCVVTFEEDLPEDVAGLIVDAIKQLRFVASVSVAASDIDHHMAKEAAKEQIRKEFLQFYKKNLMP